MTGARSMLMFLVGLVVWLAVGAAAEAQIRGPGGQQPQQQQQQQGQDVTGRARPPAPREPGEPPVWLYYLVFAALVGATVAVSIMPSKRGHQD